jgi:hypothetical protein
LLSKLFFRYLFVSENMLLSQRWLPAACAFHSAAQMFSISMKMPAA